MTEITAEHAHWLAVARVSQRWPKMYTQECRFMEKRMREISRFFIAQRREFAPAVCARPRAGVSLSLDAVLLKPAPLRLVELTLFLDSTKSMGSSNSILNRLLLSSYTSMQNHAS